MGIKVYNVFTKGMKFGSLGGINYYNLIIGDSPLTYWRLSDASGNFIDEIGNYNGTEEGTVTRQTASLIDDNDDTSINLNGLGAVAGTTAPIWNTGSDTWSIELWIRPNVDVNTSMVLYSENRIGGRYEILLAIDSDGLVNASKYPNTGTISLTRPSPTPILSGQTYHIVYTENRATRQMEIWINGVKEVYGQTSIYTGETPQYWSIGQRPYYNDIRFDGIVDEVSTYTQVLTDETIQSHYNAGIS